MWDKAFSELFNIQTWSSEIRDILLTHNLGHIFAPNNNSCPETVISQLKDSMNIKQNVDLKQQCLDKPKLRNYVQINDFGCKTPYLTIPMPFIYRKYLALTYLSNLPIRIETGRYERPKIDANLRVCQVGCDSFCIEDEYHVLFSCTMYNNMRITWLGKIKKPENFQHLPATQKLKIVLDSPLNVKITAQYLVDISNLRSKILTKKTARIPGPFI